MGVLCLAVVILRMVELDMREVSIDGRSHGSSRRLRDGRGRDGFKGQRVPLRWVEAVVNWDSTGRPANAAGSRGRAWAWKARFG